MAIKKLTEEEAANLKLVPFGKKHPLRAMLETLHKTGKARYKVYNELARTGWVVERVK